jgi:hypothetical protein
MPLVKCRKCSANIDPELYKACPWCEIILDGTELSVDPNALKDDDPWIRPSSELLENFFLYRGVSWLRASLRCVTLLLGGAFTGLIVGGVWLPGPCAPGASIAMIIGCIVGAFLALFVRKDK